MAAAADPSAVNLLVARTEQGSALRVTVYGRDAWDSQLVGSLWTAMTRRGERAQLWGTRRSRVEHEALYTLMASQAGVPTLDVVAVGVADQGDALLVTTSPRATLRDLDATALDDALLAGMWDALITLHGAGIAHGRIDAGRVVVRPDGTPALADFDAAGRASDDGDVRTDQVRLLVCTALVVGPDRALAAAVAAVGADGLADLLPYLQPAALGRGTRADVRAGAWTMDELRAAAVVASGVEEPPLERLRRVTPRSIGTLLLSALLVYVVVTLLAGVDLASVIAALKSAEWAWLVAALLLSPFIQASLAGATLGAALARLRYVPVLMLQYSIQFISLVLPATAARLALEVRFFQKFGIPPGTALSFGLIDSVMGFVVQAGLIVLVLVSGLPGFTSSLITGSEHGRAPARRARRWSWCSSRSVCWPRSSRWPSPGCATASPPASPRCGPRSRSRHARRTPRSECCASRRRCARCSAATWAPSCCRPGSWPCACRRSVRPRTSPSWSSSTPRSPCSPG